MGGLHGVAGLPLGGGLPFVYGRLFLPESAEDARTLLSPWTHKARRRHWRVRATQTPWCWSFPLAWADRLVNVVHDHVPCFLPGETPDDFHARVMRRGGASIGCTPSRGGRDWRCDLTHNRWLIHSDHDGSLRRLSSYHRFGES